MADGCNVGGHPLHWASSVISFDIQRDGSKLQTITYDQLHTVATNAFQRWLDAVCADGNHPRISVVDFGPVECAKPEYNKDQPNQNVITFHDDKWPYKNTGAETLALTSVVFSPETGELYNADIELNSYGDHFVLGAAQADEAAHLYDLNAVLTHEVGHFLGLSHSLNQQATMFNSYQLGMSTLESDDVAAICASLPADRVPADPGNPPGVPRHGFSPECGQSESGCCSSTIGGRLPPNGPLALWAFGLGAVAWRARGRTKKRSAPALPR